MTILIKKQLLSYIISGLLATGSDYLVYNMLVYLSCYYSIAKTISFLTGTIIAYFYNKHITFKKPQQSYKELARFFVLYLISMVFNVTTNGFSISILKHYFSVNISITISFLAATLISMIISFFGQKLWVFKK